ncbi:uncharacterized protein BO95DRAFT_180282 [Aspergillus brunneoviolaceus CBS 621.78]|uniref:Uncharacterized protein n=1 Tax=Aspergillus brunneoviolaceus CBS 621.78 TaxID=1450534 RepID=A0ACD1G4P4_9EURO|nr:hypothetical protein BO95DRAFT_180282 [Aspergillus brunneoviolaceus CBS 621.78]RAH44200.1 hypothetical protein BO95DRAFT_180282 [Aspergillus brunneoviolaceus CBS 621.78]
MHFINHWCFIINTPIASGFSPFHFCNSMFMSAWVMLLQSSLCAAIYSSLRRGVGHVHLGHIPAFAFNPESRICIILPVNCLHRA